MSDARSWLVWCEHALEHVRFKPDHKAIKKELTAHYEDHCRDLERIGYEPELAAERALTAMGDADEVGRALNQAHKPWLGWLWEASRVLALWLVLLLAVKLLGNGWFTAEEMLGRTMDQFTYQPPPVAADSAVTAYGLLYMAPGEVTERAGGGYEAGLNIWVETDDLRTGFPWIQNYLQVTDDQGPVPCGERDESGALPANYLSPGFQSVSYGWTRHQVTLFLRLDHRPQWVEVTYPHGGNDWILRAEWEAAE